MPDQVKRGRGTEKKTLLLELSAMILQSCPLARYRLWTLEACACHTQLSTLYDISITAYTHFFSKEVN